MKFQAFCTAPANYRLGSKNIGESDDSHQSKKVDTTHDLGQGHIYRKFRQFPKIIPIISDGA
jgi:hypothetical protein